MADESGSIEEGTYPRQKGAPKGNNGGVLDEMCANGCKGEKKQRTKKGGKQNG